MMKAFLIILSVVASAFAQDYCAICSDHIACNNDGEIDSKCSATSEMIDMSSTDLKTYFTDAHNEIRNLVASGGLDGYDSASRMATIQWDDELAYLAGLNVKTCNFDHDSCSKTEKFQYSGQNLAGWSGYQEIAPAEAAQSAIDGWFSEHENADMSVIDSYHETAEENGHFIVMVADRNIRLGCAMIKTQEGQITKFTTACNYAASYTWDSPVYIKGAAASKCTSGKNSNYPALCSTDEQVDANEFN